MALVFLPVSDIGLYVSQGRSVDIGLIMIFSILKLNSSPIDKLGEGALRIVKRCLI